MFTKAEWDKSFIFNSIRLRREWLYRGEHIDIPTRKPRKSQKNPNPQLSEEQKAANTALSRIRIFIEHAIGGMKRYNILVHTFRNRIEHFEDDVIGICAGLWNLVLSY